MRKLVFQFSVLALAACKPPPTDADMLRDMPEAAPSFASAPLPSPNVQGAKWALSQRRDGKIIYGVPNESSLLALECETQGNPTIRITRYSPADEGAGALLAMVGNGHIGRIAVDANKVSGGIYWEGTDPANSDGWEPIAGPRELIATVPGGGTVELHASPIPGAMIEACRNGVAFNAASLAEITAPEEPVSETAKPAR